LNRARPTGPLFNSYNFGGYLMWAYPSERVFIDGRAFTVYSEDHLRELARVYEEPTPFTELEHPFGFRLCGHQTQGLGAGFARWLSAQPDWKVAYADDLAIVLSRTAAP